MAYPFNYNLPTPAGDGKFNFQPPQRTPYDRVDLGQFTIPGISKLSITRNRKAKVQTKKKDKGDRLVDSGLELATIRITTRIFFEPQYEEMDEILNFFEHRIGLGTATTAESFKIDHPDTRSRGIFNVFIESIEGPTHYMPPGYSEYTFTCKEVVNQKKQTPKTQKPAKQGPIETTTPLNADFGGQQPSKDKEVTGPKRGKLPKKT